MAPSRVSSFLFQDAALRMLSNARRYVLPFAFCDAQAGQTFIQLSWCYVQFFVGVCMFVIVAWLLIFRTKELKECWKTHARFRFYVEPTLVGTAVHLGLGVCGTIDVVSEEFE